MRRPLPYRNQSIDLQSKSMDWFLYDNDLRHEMVKVMRLQALLLSHQHISQLGPLVHKSTHNQQKKKEVC